jgi:putative NADH-flavin reductase
MKGDVTDAESLVRALVDVDIVISCFGPTNHRKVGNLMSAGTINIVNTCQTLDIKKLVFMSGFLQSDSNEFSYLMRPIVKLLQSYYHVSYNDKIIAEGAVEKSTLDWVIVRASSLLQVKPAGRYKAGAKVRISPFAPLSYSDCALCLLDAIEEKRWTRQIITVGQK